LIVTVCLSIPEQLIFAVLLKLQPHLNVWTGECASHLLLSQHNLAPPLLARFSNGLLYRYVAGYVCSVDDLAVPQTWKAVARRLGQWHGILPTEPASVGLNNHEMLQPANTLWGVLRKWISVLPSSNDAEKAQKEELRRELAVLETSLETGGYGLKGKDGGVGLITGHCDLLNGNVIILPGRPGEERKVHFIDYE
jgi:ethanolamine kinase